MDPLQLSLLPAPRAVFDSLEARRDRARFVLPDGRTVSWGAFAQDIRQAASFLREMGLAPGDRASIFAPNSVEWMSAALAIQAAGGAMVPVYPASTAEQASFVIGHCDARVLFVDAALLPRVRTDACPALETIVLLGASCEMGANPKSQPAHAWSSALAIGAAADARDPGAFERTLHGVSLDQTGLMLYTSGTSGNPKGVPLTHRNVGVNGRDWLESNAPLLDLAGERPNTDLLWLPMSHIFGYGEACLGNTCGFTTHLADPASAIARMPDVRPTVFMSVPALWEKLAMASGGDTARLQALTGGRLRFCLSGGAGLKVEVKELFHRAGILIIEGYGLTETSPTLTLNRPDAFRFDSVGKPLPSVELRLAGDGEILAKGPSVFRGYHKDPAATREAFDGEGWFKTGDVGRFTADGFLQIIDRKKDILVTAGGKNVPPANIEMRFRDDPWISHVVVYGDGKRYLVAGVWPNCEALASRDDAAALLQTSVDKVNAALASYETIKRFWVADAPLSVEAGFLTASLKVRRKRIYETFRDRFEDLYQEPMQVRAAP